MKDIRTRPVLLEKLQNFKEEVVTSDVDRFVCCAQKIHSGIVQKRMCWKCQNS